MSVGRPEHRFVCRLCGKEMSFPDKEFGEAAMLMHVRDVHGQDVGAPKKAMPTELAGIPIVVTEQMPKLTAQDIVLGRPGS